MDYRVEGAMCTLGPRVRMCDPVEFSHPARQPGSLLCTTPFTGAVRVIRMM